MDRTRNYSLADPSSTGGNPNSSIRSSVKSFKGLLRTSKKMSSFKHDNRHSMPPRYTSFDWENANDINAATIGTDASSVGGGGKLERSGSAEVLSPKIFTSPISAQKTFVDITAAVETASNDDEIFSDESRPAVVFKKVDKPPKEVSFKLDEASPDDDDDDVTVVDGDGSSPPVLTISEEYDDDADELPSRLSRKRSQPVIRRRPKVQPFFIEKPKSSAGAFRFFLSRLLLLIS